MEEKEGRKYALLKDNLWYTMLLQSLFEIMKGSFSRLPIPLAMQMLEPTWLEEKSLMLENCTLVSLGSKATSPIRCRDLNL